MSARTGNPAKPLDNTPEPLTPRHWDYRPDDDQLGCLDGPDRGVAAPQPQRYRRQCRALARDDYSFGEILNLDQFSAVPGSGPGHNEASVFASLPLEPGQHFDTDAYFGSVRSLAVHLIDQLLQQEHRRGYVETLHALRTPTSACSDVQVTEDLPSPAMALRPGRMERPRLRVRARITPTTPRRYPTLTGSYSYERTEPSSSRCPGR